MSVLYGRVRGSANTEATRQGTEASGIYTSAETWTSKVVVDLEANGDCQVVLMTKQGMPVKILFDGNIDEEVSNDDPTARVLRLPVHECVQCSRTCSDRYMQLMAVNNHLDWFCMECAEHVIRTRAEEVRS